MTATLPPPLRLSLTMALLWFLQLVSIQNLYAQTNGSYTVDLTGNPNGSWTSPNVSREGSFCAGGNCIEFIVTLNKNAGGLEIISEGANGTEYQINCGTPKKVGQPICVDGIGPHKVTFCKPGGDKTTYTIRSIAAFEPQPDVSVTTGCSAELKAPIAFEESSITWKDVTGGGIYNKYLSFPNGKSTAIVTPDDDAPAFVDYEVCGNSVASPCSSLPYCDVVRVYFHKKPVVTIGPDPAIICPGGSSVALTGTVTGGDGNFTYIWTNSSGDVVGNALTYNATAVGTYKLEVKNTNQLNCQEFSATVNVVTNLTVNAGPDQLACSQNTVQLAGVVTAATGGTWTSSGSGTFSDRNVLNAIYTPSLADIAAGSVRLTLTSTGNGSCTAVTDQVLITFYSMDVSLAGPNLVCDGNLATITASVTGAQGAVSYLWSTGETTASISNKPAGTYNVTVRDEKSCSVQKSITITQATGPTALAVTLKPSTCGNSNGEITVTGVTGGTAGYTYSRNGTTFQSATSFTGLAAGSYTITVKDANGCTFASSYTLTNSAGPTALTATSIPASCQNNDGSINVGTVTGGTAPYTYAVGSSAFQTSTAFTGFAAGAYVVTVKDANGCLKTTSVSITTSVPTGFTSTSTAATCGSNNGEVTITGVTGGFAPYTYSKDGSTFQSSATLQNLLPGSHTITVKDDRGCTTSSQVQVSNVAGPSDLTTTVKATTCGGSNGEITVTAVTGGTGSYTYSKNGTTFQTSATFTALAVGAHTITVKDEKGCTYSKEVAVSSIAGATFTATAQSSTCGNSNGSISVSNVTGGVGPYTYSLDGINYQPGTTFSNLAADTYTIRVKDASECVGAATVEVQNVAGPSDAAVDVFAAICGNNNGYFRVTGVTGGTAPYMYARNGMPFQEYDTFGSLAPGDYTVTVRDANGCLYTESVTILSQPGPSSFAGTTKSTTCSQSNGEITVTEVIGGTTPYRYSINGGTTYQTGNTFTGLAAGKYYITVADRNTCTLVREFNITNMAGPTAVAATTIPASCANNDGTITAGTVTGGTASYTYSIDGTNFQSETTFAHLASGNYTLTVKDANGCTVTRQVTVTKSEVSNFASTSTSSTCGSSNGEISVTGVTGGTAPYSYSKGGGTYQTSATFTALEAGNYQVSVKDARGCVYTKTVQVTNVAGPVFTATAQSSTCSSSNGSITVGNVTGGTAPYSYSKDGTIFQDGTTFSNLTAGEYTIVTKDANNCVSTRVVQVQDIAGPSDADVEIFAATCSISNGYFRVKGVTGGTAPYMYARNGTPFQEYDTFGSLSPGDYTISVKDAKGCIYTESVTIPGIPGPSDFTGTTQASTCGQPNGEITITGVTGGTAPYRYSKDGGTTYQGNIFTGLAAGTHTITVTDKTGCSIVRAFTLTNVAGPTAVAATSTPASCQNNDGTITAGTVTGGTAPYTYSINGTSYQSETAFASVASGTYTLTAKDANGCTTTKQVTVGRNVPTNFTTTTVASTCGSNNGEITVTGVTGGTASYTYSKDGTNFQNSSTFTGLLAGAYTITVKDAKGCVFAKQIQVSNITGPTGLTATAQASTCGNSNGEITITGVTGGTASYTYSKDGTNFQASGTFQNLLAGTYTITVKDAKGCLHAQEVVVTNIAGPEFTAVAQASTCGNSNGSVTISNVAGGTAPFTYSKDGTNFQTSATFTALAAGEYDITVKDLNGCLSTKAVRVTNIPGPTDFALTSTPSTCGRNNGILEITDVTGGTAPYTYSINGTTFQSAVAFETVRAGEYTVTVKDANGCIISKKVIVSDVAGPSNLTASLTSSTCGQSNGQIAVTGVTGGTEGYTYSKDGVNFQAAATFTALAAGQHTITVRDANGCTFARSFTITNIAGPTAVTATSTPASCLDNDGTITAGTVTGGTAPYTYSINGTSFQSEAAFAGVASGTFTLTAKDANGCTATTQVTVGTNVPTSFTSTTASATCGSSNGSLTITGVTGGTGTYTYSKDGTNFQAAATFTALAAGSHTITVKDAKGCVYTGQVQVNNLSGPSDLVASTRSTTCGGSNGSLTVTSVSGGVAPYTYSLDGTNFQTGGTFSDLLAGKHQVSVKDSKGCVYTEEVEITDVAAPSFTATAQASTCGNSNGSITISEVTGGTAPFSFSKDGTNFQAGTTFNGLAEGAYTITVKDANGCLGTASVELENIPGPTDFTVVSNSSTCSGSNGTITASDVAGGTAPFTYSINGTSFQASAMFETVKAGDYTVTVKDANGCIITKNITVGDIAGPSNLTTSLTSSTCGQSNGQIMVTGVTGGTEPYRHSKDGVNFQAAATFTALAAGQHTITVRDANGCTFARSFTITNIAGPTAVTATSTPASCLDNDGTITAGTVTGGTAPYTYSINGTSFQAEAAFAGVASGTFTLTAKDANGCMTTTQVTVGTNAPTEFASTTNASTCGSSNGSLTITGVTGGTAPYTYSLNGTTFQNAATFTALAAGVYEVTVKDAKGCIYKTDVQLSDVGGPAFTATAQASTCGNSNGQVSAGNITGGTAPYTYSIDGTNFQAAATFSNLTAGSYSITAKDANSCITTQAVEVEDIAGPSDFELLATASTCGNSNGRITIGAVTHGTAPYAYSINGTNFQASATFTALAAQAYTVTVKDANGCTFEKRTLVENVSGPTDFTASTKTSFCGSANGEVTVVDVNGGTAPYTYSKNGSIFQASTTLTGLAAGNHIIYVKDANDCIFNKPFTIRNVAGPSALAATSTPATCAGNDGSLTAGAVTGGTAPYTYSVDGVNYQAAATFTALAPREYQVYVKDANNCTTSTAVTVGSEVMQEATLAATPSGCTTSTGTIRVTDVTGGTAPYTYSINGTSFQAAALFENVAVGSYTITVKDAAGCVITRTQVVASTGGATALTATTTNSSCGNTDGSLSISNVTGGRSPYTYSIDGTTFQAQAAFANLAAGDYQITVKDAEGCTYVQTATVNSNGQLANLQVKVTPSGCDQNSGQVVAEGVTGGTAPYTYSLDGVNFSASSTFMGVAQGSYTLTVKDASNCSTTTTVEVGMVSSTLENVKDESCFGAADGEIIITATGATDQTEYSIDNGATFQKQAVFTNLPKGVYQVITRFSATCSITIGTAEVKGPDEIVAIVTPRTKSFGHQNTGSAAVTKVEGGVAPYTYKVDNGSFTTATEFTKLGAGVHKVLVKDANGCTVEVTFTIEDESGIEIPNGFTPNGDRMNDTWEIKNLARLYPRCRVTVYNRWGSLVFESMGYNKEWDGTYNGKKLPVGTYYCIVELGEGQPPVKKSLTIMR
ncbi:gliding motility-associated C-terminal domain-containing protein [Pontibacter toksunensis]|uniref:Gliding motility-associated C-terminal domain-containing protein n=1 Tax=Pontibacter toksunensis TaxID=1332631 RepID=A0ABW6BZD9_9BACT